MFTRSARQSSFDEGDASDESPARSASCECARAASLEGPRDTSGDSHDEPDDESEPEEESPPPEPPRPPRARGVSSDRYPPRSPADRAPLHGIFERRLPRFCKLGRLEKSKRASASVLYDRSPTEALYNETGSARLSSQELFEKFCSEDFTSLYGREDERRRRAPHSKSTGSSGSDVRHERPCCRRAAAASQASLGLGAVRRHPCAARGPARSDRSTDSEEHPSPRARDRPHPLRYPEHSYEDSEEERADGEPDEHARSAPLLSPDRADARFTFDISERSEAPSNRDTQSDATETRNLTLYEEPHSDRTSLCELYDACFASGGPALRRDSRRRCGFDLTNLDFRAIDDESPRASRRASQRSADETMRQNSDSRSWCSDSVFTTPERRARDTASPSSADTRRRLTPRTDSAMAYSTAAEEEPASVIEIAAEVAPPPPTPPPPPSEDEQETVAAVVERNGAALTSRPSMHKLEPLEAERTGSVEPERRYQKVVEPAELKAETRPRRARSPFFHGRKSREGSASGSRSRRQTRCFPL